MENVKHKSGVISTDSLKKETVEISGMTCGSCANNVQRALSQLGGVHSAKVDLNASSATVEYDPKMVSRDNMKEAVERIGYKFGAQTSGKQSRERRRGGCC